MTIKELIEKLSAYPPEMRVFSHDGEYDDFWDIKDIYTVPADRVKENFAGEQVLKLSPFDDGRNR